MSKTLILVNKNNNTEKALKFIEKEILDKLKVIKFKDVHLTKDKALILFEHSKRCKNYNTLLENLCNKDCIVYVIEKTNAVEECNRLFEKMNLKNSELIYTSISDKNARLDVELFFGENSYLL